MLRAETRVALDVIDTLLMSLSPDAAAALWDVLSGLRGPDDNTADKNKTTAIIRAKAFPRWARESSGIGRFQYSRRGGAEVNLQDEIELPNTTSHFYHHITKAARALGLIDKQD